MKYFDPSISFIHDYSLVRIDTLAYFVETVRFSICSNLVSIEKKIVYCLAYIFVPIRRNHPQLNAEIFTAFDFISPSIHVFVQVIRLES